MKGNLGLSLFGTGCTILCADDDFIDFEGVGGAFYPFSVLMSETKKISEKLENALGRLDAELRAVLESKFGLNSSGDGKVHSDAKVADDLGGTEESIAALEELALRALYSSSITKK